MAQARALAGKGYRLSMLPRDWLIRKTLARIGFQARLDWPTYLKLSGVRRPRGAASQMQSSANVSASGCLPSRS